MRIVCNCWKQTSHSQSKVPAWTALLSALLVRLCFVWQPSWILWKSTIGHLELISLSTFSNLCCGAMQGLEHGLQFLSHDLVIGRGGVHRHVWVWRILILGDEDNIWILSVVQSDSSSPRTAIFQKKRSKKSTFWRKKEHFFKKKSTFCGAFYHIFWFEIKFCFSDYSLIMAKI